MIRAVAFCPGAPVLIPEVAQGAAPELDALRAACRSAIERVAGPDPHWHVIGAGDTSRLFRPGSQGSLAGLGVPLEVALGRVGTGPATLPLSLTVGAWLLNDAVGPVNGAMASSIGGEAGVERRWVADRDTALLVVGDGSARRGVKAPGYLDDRAAAFDARIETALRSGDPQALAALEPGLGADLLAAGVPVWRAVAPALAGRPWDATLHYSGNPYGVAYFAASWVARD